MGTPSKFEHFTEEELACRCGKCGLGAKDMDENFMMKVVMMRKEAGFPFPVSSAIRCPEHNRNVSHTKSLDGDHVEGNTIDVEVSRGRAWKFAALAFKYGFKRIGFQQKGNKRFIHISDSDRNPSPTIWSY